MSAADFTKLANIPTVVATRTTLSGSATTISVTGLHGNTDGDYECDGTFILAAAAVFNTLTVQPNADTGNATCDQIESRTTTLGASSLASLALAVANTTTLGSTVNVRFRLKSKAADGPRYFDSTAFWLDGASANRATAQTTGRWTDITNEITQITVASNQANSLQSGTFLRCRSQGFTQ